MAFARAGRVQRDIAAACHHERIAVRVSPDRGRHGDQAVAVWPVFHDDLVAPILTEFGAYKSRRNVGDTPGRVRTRTRTGRSGKVWAFTGAASTTKNAATVII